MDQFRKYVESDIEGLLTAQTDDLLTQLGLRAREAVQSPSSAALLEGVRTPKSHEMGIDIRSIGDKIFKRLNRELHSLVCGQASDDVEDRNKILDAIDMGHMAVAVTVAQVLIASFGLAPAIATVVAVIFVKRVVQPCVGELCDYWGASIKN